MYINDASSHIGKNRQVIRDILHNIGIDWIIYNWTAFTKITGEIDRCNAKYAYDNNYNFIKQIYENIKIERRGLNTLLIITPIKNETFTDLNKYIETIFS